jgi:anion-transporting  ArsA/GET3 family ATPase
MRGCARRSSPITTTSSCPARSAARESWSPWNGSWKRPQEGGHDLLIVDTPPSQHALDFLDAPQRIINLLDGSMTGWLVRPYGLAARAQFNLFRQSSAVALKFMERFTGCRCWPICRISCWRSPACSTASKSVHKVQATHAGADTAFLLVCAPEPASLAQAAQFAARLNRDGMNIAGLLANRVHEAPPGLTD